ncbi:hypothetical protein [Maricaulis sp.]|uniref:hypothetical protein n=1 Tax=Maricaulis sp. TaxID=1486257 RepID=UPI001B17281F|nr:hypothetical protein [Maricaulis sp.]MBO6796183.1 hypothetical protein [Maricaulis sp.]
MRDLLPVWLPRAAIEALLIVFAVVLGFLVNEWRADRAAETRANLALTRIVGEMRDNLEALETAAEYHAQIVENLTAIEAEVQSGELPSSANLFETVMPAMPMGISPPILSDVAWEYAGQTGALDQLDFEIMSEVARLYSVQELGTETTWKMIIDAFFFNEESFEIREISAKLSFMRLSFTELVSQERSLIFTYRSVIAQVEALVGIEPAAEDVGE